MALTLATISFNAQAFWGGNNNNWGNNGNSDNDWPVWTPMYWMDEMIGNDNYSNYYGNANPWSGSSMNNMPMNTMRFNTNPWSNGPMNGSMNGFSFPPNGYSPYVGGGPNAGYPAGYPQGYRPLSGFQNRPLAPSRGPTSIRP